MCNQPKQYAHLLCNIYLDYYVVILHFLHYNFRTMQGVINHMLVIHAFILVVQRKCRLSFFTAVAMQQDDKNTSLILHHTECIKIGTLL